MGVKYWLKFLALSLAELTFVLSALGFYLFKNDIHFKSTVIMGIFCIVLKLDKDES